MLRVRQVKIDVLLDSEDKIKSALIKKMKIKDSDILSWEISKQSLDARDKNNIFYVYELVVQIKNEDAYLNRNYINDIIPYQKEEYQFLKVGTKQLENQIVIVGSGPAGLFAAYILAENGYKPLIIERGKCIEKRAGDVNEFWKSGVLNPNSNVQFGEGGAGTFSDGKLNTLVKDENHRMKKVFETFVECGAPREILYSYKPHIGTDILRQVIIKMREKIKNMGGNFLYETCLTDICYENNCLKSIVINNDQQIKCDALVLAIGHSARDTFEMLYSKKINMIGKPFAVGVRVQHLQEDINHSQYGSKYARVLGAASYKITNKASNGKGVYTFCMCPGGFVVNASSEEGHLAINGMSNHDRNEKNANSAVIVTVSPEDYGFDPLDGMKFQKSLEKKAYELGQGKIPVQLLKDYNEGSLSTGFGKITPVVKGEISFADLNDLFPLNINEAIKSSMHSFGKKIKGFDDPDTILAGVESRSSSPVKIIRDENYESNIKGIYPCGEGAGYAGGITSAAMDGIKVAEAIGKIYK